MDRILLGEMDQLVRFEGGGSVPVHDDKEPFASYYQVMVFLKVLVFAVGLTLFVVGTYNIVVFVVI